MTWYLEAGPQDQGTSKQSDSSPPSSNKLSFTTHTMSYMVQAHNNDQQWNILNFILFTDTS